MLHLYAAAAKADFRTSLVYSVLLQEQIILPYFERMAIFRILLQCSALVEHNSISCCCSMPLYLHMKVLKLSKYKIKHAWVPFESFTKEQQPD